MLARCSRVIWTPHGLTGFVRVDFFAVFSRGSPKSAEFRLSIFEKICLAFMGTKNYNGRSPIYNKNTVVFVLGGPGSGKGTQCANIVKHFGFTHLSAGDLLRAEIKSGSEFGTMIQNMMNEGKIVPSEVTIKLLQRAMLESGNDKFLIDGFPRNEENRVAFESVTKVEPEFVLFFDCPEGKLEQRLLNRNQGRDDDNIDTIRKRFKVFRESTIPVVEYYGRKGKVRKVDAAKPIDEIFEDVKMIFAPFRTQANHLGNPNFNTEIGSEHSVCPCPFKWLLRDARNHKTVSKALFWKKV